MSTLKTHNLQSPDAASANIALTPNAGMVVAGISTLGSGAAGGVDLLHQNVSRLSTQSYGIAVNGNILLQEELVHIGDTDTRIRFPAADTVTVETAGSERFRIDSSGRVGINTVSPGRLLEINTTGTSTEGIVVKSNDNTYPKLQFGANRTNADAFLGLIIASVDGTDVASIHFETGSDTTNKDDGLISFRTASAGTREERLRIASDGNVGINTNNPTEQLEIYNGASSGDSTFRMRSLDSSTKITLDARGTNASNMIYFTDSSAVYNSFINRSHSSNANFAGLKYAYNGSAHVAVRISESGGFEFGDSGNLLANSGSYGTAGQVLRSNGNSPPSWSGGSQRVLEVVASPCDGSTISTSNGDVTFQNVTGVQNLSTTFTDVTGSKITYTPPTGTTQVIYEFNFQASRLDGLAISHYRMYIDGNEVTYMRSEIAAEDQSVRTTIRWIFNIGGSQNNATGRQSSWTSGKEIKLQAEDYGSSYDIQLHETNWWNGTATDQFSMPTLSLTAIGV